MIPVEEAAALIVADLRRTSVETVALRDAMGRVLAEDVVSDVALPPWDNSSMDGYAVRGDDVIGASAESPVRLPVGGTIAAGAGAPPALAAGTAMRIMTGAPVPPGADTVIRVEDTDHGTEVVEIRGARDLRRNIRLRGEDVQPGARVLPAGTKLGAAQLAVLASVGRAHPHVHRLPLVAIVTTGDELVDVDRFDEVRAGRRIVSSNSYSLRSAVVAAGGVPVDQGIVGDDLDRLVEVLRDASSSCDLVITSGGVSVGAFDYTRSAIRALGGEPIIRRVTMRPGAPLGFGWIGSTPWIGLPGNPVSALVTFELFARPAIRLLRGETKLFPLPIPVRVEDDVALAAPLTHFLRVVIGIGDDGVLEARLTGAQGSGVMTTTAAANALLVVPAGTTAVTRGSMLRAIPLDTPLLTDSLRL
jgi:molybdopterin molybdotransferase